MNESIHRKSAMAFKFKNTKTGLPMGVWWAGLFVVLLINLTTVAFAQSSCPGIHVKVLNIRNSTGTVDCALFDSPAGFPIEALLSNVEHLLETSPGTYALRHS